MAEAVTIAVVVVALIPAAACTWVGFGHALAPDALSEAMQQLAVVRRRMPSNAIRALARCWGTVEAGTGIAVGGALLMPSLNAARAPALVWLMIVYIGFATWLAVLWRRVPTAICGCGAHSEPADGLTLLRTGVLGGCTLIPVVALMAGFRMAVPPYGWVAVPVAVTLATLIWIQPASARPRELAT